MGSFNKLTIHKLALLLLTFILLLLLRLRQAILSPSITDSCQTPKLAPASSRFEEWLFEQESRRARIARACGNKTKGRRNNDKFNFYFNEDDNDMVNPHGRSSLGDLCIKNDRRSWTTPTPTTTPTTTTWFNQVVDPTWVTSA